MKSFFLSLAVTSFATIALVACGSDDPKSACEDACKKVAECQDGDDDDADSCIEASCDSLGEIDIDDCNSEISAYYECQAEQICDEDGDTDCDDKLDDLEQCARDYCEDNEDDDACSELQSSSSRARVFATFRGRAL